MVLVSVSMGHPGMEREWADVRQKGMLLADTVQFSSVQFSPSVVSDSL